MVDPTPTVEQVEYDFTSYQALHRQWRRRNFGRALLHQPVLGVIEELCELEEAREENVVESLTGSGLHTIESSYLVQHTARTRLSEKELDAIGDILIYTMDLCSAYGWTMQGLWEERVPAVAIVSWTRIIGKLAHHQLKAEQNIRGGVDHQEMMLRGTVLVLLSALEAHCAAHGEGPTLLVVLDNVWAAVSKRDWRAKPDTAHVGLG